MSIQQVINRVRGILWGENPSDEKTYPSDFSNPSKIKAGTFIEKLLRPLQDMEEQGLPETDEVVLRDSKGIYHIVQIKSISDDKILLTCDSTTPPLKLTIATDSDGNLKLDPDEIKALME